MPAQLKRWDNAKAEEQVPLSLTLEGSRIESCICKHITIENTEVEDANSSTRRGPSPGFGAVQVQAHLFGAQREWLDRGITSKAKSSIPNTDA